MKHKILYLKWGITGEYDVELAFQELPYEVSIYAARPESVDYDTNYLKAVGEQIVKQQCDAVFSLNYIPVVSRVCQLAGVSYVTWTVDSPEIMLYSKTLRNSCNHTYLFDQAMCERFAPYASPGQIYYQPLGSNVKRWDSVRIEESDWEQYGADISFVGSLYSEKCPYNCISFSNEYARGMAEGLINAQLPVYGYNFLAESMPEDVVGLLRKEAGYQNLGEDYYQVDRELLADHYLGLKCTEQERIRMLTALAQQFSVDVYTQSDTKNIKGIHNRGIVDYEIGMAKVMKCSKINLNFTSKPIQTGLPLRMLDIMGCGGFLLTNYQAEIPLYFEIGKDLVIYESQQDLIEKAAYYLSHEEERREIAENGYEKVKREYSLQNQMAKVFAKIFI